MTSKDIKYFDFYLFFLLSTEIISNLGGLLSGFNIFRGAVILSYVIWLFFITLKPIKTTAVVLVILFIVYSLVLVLFSENQYQSFYNFNKVFPSLLIFPFAINNLDYKKIIIVFRTLGNIIILYAIYLIIAVTVGIGSGAYLDDGYTTGGVNINTLTYLSIISPGLLMLNIFQGKKRLIFILALTISIVFLLVSMKRTTLAILLVSMAIYLFSLKGKTLLLYLRFLIIGSILLFATSTYWLSSFLSRYEQRADAMKVDVELLEGEGRTLELEAVLIETFRFEDLSYSFFGRSAFHTPGQYGINVGYYFRTTRMIHNDIAVLFNSTGILGFLIYFSFYMLILIRYLKFRKHYKKIENGNIYLTLYTIVLISSIMLMYNGSLLALGNRTIAYVFFGLLFTKPLLNTEYQKHLTRQRVNS